MHIRLRNDRYKIRFIVIADQRAKDYSMYFKLLKGNSVALKYL